MINFSKNNRTLQCICLIIIVVTVLKYLDLFFHFDREPSIMVSLFSPSESEQQNSTLLRQEMRHQIDYKYCGGPCKFLNLNLITEQETRSQLHLRQFAFTAGLINRTFVLPNVADSRIGACQAYDFTYYYDIRWAQNNAQHFKHITMTEFKSWLIERQSNGVPASDQIMSIFNSFTTPHPTPKEQRKHCLSKYTKSKTNLTQVMAWNVKADDFEQKGEAQLVDFLKGGEGASLDGTLFENDDIDILHINLNKGNAFSYHPAASIPIPYSPELIQLADNTSKQLGPFVAVHWRMETIRRSENLIRCAHRLISTLDKFNKKNMMQVFLLTDYPHSFTQEQQALAISDDDEPTKDVLMASWVQSTSDTFHLNNFTPNHHRAIQYLYSHHPFILFETKTTTLSKKIENWMLIPIPKELQKISVRRGKNGFIDGGWLGILDKLMAIRSQYFFAGKGRVCARASTFTKQIVEERKSHHKDADIQYFGF